MTGSWTSPPANPPDPAQRRREIQLLVLATLGTVMVAVDSTIVILALPTMAKDLQAPLETVIWTILVYLLITAALTTQAGRVGDILGRSRVYNAGFAVFTIGSALSGFAPGAEFLIAARVVQAIGGAVMFADASALIADVFPPERRGRAFGYVTFGWSVGAILGILLGGVITTALGWRYIFFINLPIGAVAVALGLSMLPRSTPRPARLDVPGFLAFSAALGLVCYGAIEIAANGVSQLSLIEVVVGGALFAVFVALELKSADPLLDLRQLRERLLGFSLGAAFLQSLGYLSVVFLLTLYLQGLRGLSPLNASLLLVPGYLVGAIAGPQMGHLSDRLGHRAIATGGILCMAGAVVLYAQLGLGSWLGWVPAISVLGGFGIGMFFPANTAAVMSRARPATFGSISGLRGTLTNLGTLFSFVLTLSIASATVPRYVAYSVFLGLGNLAGGLSSQFLSGLHAALYGMAVVLLIAATLSWSRGPTPARTAASPPGPAPPRASTDR